MAWLWNAVLLALNESNAQLGGGETILGGRTANYLAIMRPLGRGHRRSDIVKTENCPLWAVNSAIKAPAQRTAHDFGSR